MRRDTLHLIFKANFQFVETVSGINTPYSKVATDTTMYRAYEIACTVA